MRSDGAQVCSGAVLSAQAFVPAHGSLATSFGARDSWADNPDEIFLSEGATRALFEVMETTVRNRISDRSPILS